MKDSFNSQGTEYISLRRASEISGYSSDYIGQLCRAKKLDCRMIGRSWFVTEQTLQDHKKKVLENETHRDHLANLSGEKKSEHLKVVQNNSAATSKQSPLVITTETNVTPVTNPITTSVTISAKEASTSGFTYTSDKRDLLPTLSKNGVKKESSLDANPLKNLTILGNQVQLATSPSSTPLPKLQSGIPPIVWKFSYEPSPDLHPLILKPKTSIVKIARTNHDESGDKITPDFKHKNILSSNVSEKKQTPISHTYRAHMSYVPAAAFAVVVLAFGFVAFTSNLGMSYKNNSIVTLNSASAIDSVRQWGRNIICFFITCSDGGDTSELVLMPGRIGQGGPTSPNTLPTIVGNNSNRQALTQNFITQQGVTSTEVDERIRRAIETALGMQSLMTAQNVQFSPVYQQIQNQAGSLGDSMGRNISDAIGGVTLNGTFTTPTINGGSINGATITSSTFSSGTGVFTGNVSMAGQLTVSGTGTSTVAGDVAFDNNTLYIDSLNNRVGIGTSSPVDTLSVNGPIYLADVSPSVTSHRLYVNGGDLYYAGSLIGGASTGNWAANGTDVYRATGNVGIGTTTPWAQLSVNPNGITGPAFAVGSSTATNFIVTNGGNVGIGTVAPANKFHVSLDGTTVDSNLYIGSEASVLSGNLSTTQRMISGAAAGSSAALIMIKARTSVAAPSIVQADDQVANILGQIYDGTTRQNIAQILMSVDGTPGSGDSPGRMTFMTTPDGSGSLTERMRITNAGNVGIGSTSPYAKLSVKGAGSTTGVNFQTTNSSDSPLFTILDSGNVGIGTTSPPVKLTIQDTSSTRVHVVAGATTGNAITALYSDNLGAELDLIQFGTTAAGTTFGLARANNNFIQGAPGTAMGIGTSNATPLHFATNATIGMTLLSGGNVGIGTTSPYAKLSVVGQVVGAYFTATTTTASTFPYASTTALTISGNTWMTGLTANSLIATDANKMLVSTTTIGVTNLALAQGNFLVGNDAGVAQATSSIFVSSTGNVGIGTTNPTAVNTNAHLTVAGTGSQDIIASTTDNTTLSDAILQAYAPQSRTFIGAHGINQVSTRYGITLGGWGEIGQFDNNGATNGLIIGVNTAKPLVFGTNNLERVRIDGSGNFGIGTTSPWGKLSINNSTADTAGQPLFVVASSTASATTTQFIVTNSGNVGIGTTSPQATLGMQGSLGVNSSQLYLAASGNVGIGTAAPATPLETVGSIRSSRSGTASQYLEFSAGGSTGPVITAAGSGKTLAINNTSTGGIAFQTVGFGQPMTILDVGRVGIGTTTPNNMLDLYSTTKSALGFSGASGNTYKWTIGMDVSNGGRFSIASSTALGTTDRFVIDGNGNVGIATTSLSSLFSLQNNYGNSTTNLFAIASSTAANGSTANTLFSISNTGVFTASTTNSAAATSTINGNLYVNGTLRSNLSYVGDLIFANNFSFTEAPLGASTTQGLLLRNQYGMDVLTADEKGNLSVVGDVCYQGKQCFGKSLGDLSDYVSVLASSTANSQFSTQAATLSLSELTASMGKVNLALSDLGARVDALASTSMMLNNQAAVLVASSTFISSLASSTVSLIVSNSANLLASTTASILVGTAGNNQPASSTPFLTRIFSSFMDFLATAITRIKSIFVGELHVGDKLCVDDVCVNKDQLKALLINAGGTKGNATSTSEVTPPTVSHEATPSQSNTNNSAATSTTTGGATSTFTPPVATPNAATSTPVTTPVTTSPTPPTPVTPPIPSTLTTPVTSTPSTVPTTPAAPATPSTEILPPPVTPTPAPEPVVTVTPPPVSQPIAEPEPVTAPAPVEVAP